MAASKAKTGTRAGTKSGTRSGTARKTKAAAKRRPKSPAGTSTKRGSPRASSRRRNPIDDALARLERDVPRLLRQLRSSVQDLHRQVARARSDGEKRWQKAERKLKQDASRLRARLEGAIGRVRGARSAKPSGPTRGSRRSATAPKPRKSGRGRAR